jgi:hypothetical protein
MLITQLLISENCKENHIYISEPENDSKIRSVHTGMGRSR